MFYFGLTHGQIAHKVAGLINSHNNLSAMRTVGDIQHGRTDYIVETHGVWVLGAVGLDRQSYTFTEIKHLVVHPEWRGKGIAKHLLKRALNIVGTKMAYATVREGNTPSLKLFESFGFRRAGEYATEDHRVVLLIRVSPQWKQIKSSSKSHWTSAEKAVREMVRTTLKSSAPGSTKEESN